MRFFISLILLTALLGYKTTDTPIDGFVNIKNFSPEITVDLRYYSSNNFVGDTIDGYNANKCIISEEAALALAMVQKELKSMNYGLKIFDAYRPQQAVDHFVRWGKDLKDQKMKSVIQT